MASRLWMEILSQQQRVYTSLAIFWRAVENNTVAARLTFYFTLDLSLTCFVLCMSWKNDSLNPFHFDARLKMACRAFWNRPAVPSPKEILQQESLHVEKKTEN